ncbi:MAG TPA: vitamin K epoxide reductase family protein [Candidatus Saccharimonadales bacterium]|nr:vitamin K epoxide reductase family protein [Candidatus Saccharimonadales bacterium]
MSAQTKIPKAAAPNSKPTLEQVLPWLLLIGGAIGMIAAGILANDYVTALKNPSFRPVCDLNPIFSCSNVMLSHQARAFGLPNEFIGLPGYAILATTGAVLIAGAKLRRRFWQLFNLGLLFAIGFLTWLQFQTLYRIGALCIFCMVLWTVTIPMFWYVTLYNLGNGNVSVPTKLRKPVAFLRRHHGDILILWFLIIIALILKRFWYYWSTLV